jgi:hypothetical protein
MATSTEQKASTPSVTPVAASMAAPITILAATRFEARAVRRALRGAHGSGVRILEGGVGLTRLRGGELGDVVVSCGLAGGLRTDVPTGAVLIPRQVLRPTGELLTCDPELVALLETAARRLGVESEPGPMVTTASLLTGEARRAWAERGYVGVDMETGLFTAPRMAAVRVVLDTPSHDLSEVWLRAGAALLHPSAWPELPWLWREAPRCTRLAARILAEALTLRHSPPPATPAPRPE